MQVVRSVGSPSNAGRTIRQHGIDNIININQSPARNSSLVRRAAEPQRARSCSALPYSPRPVALLQVPMVADAPRTAGAANFACNAPPCYPPLCLAAGHAPNRLRTALGHARRGPGEAEAI